MLNSKLFWFLVAHVRIVGKYCGRLDHEKSNEMLVCVGLLRSLLLFYASHELALGSFMK